MVRNKHHSDESRRRSRERNDDEVKRKRRNKNGKLAAREIKHYQATTFLLLRRAPFQRFVREIVFEMFPSFSYRFQESALMAMQEAAEAYMVNLFGQTSWVAVNSKRKTVMARDMQLDRDIQEGLDLLKHLEKEQLNELLNDSEKRMNFVKSLSKITNLEEERNALIEENKRIAEANLACESSYSIQRQALIKSLEECQKLKDELFTKKTRLCEFGRQNSMDTTMALMQAAMQEAEEESDAVANAFLAKEMSIEQFIKAFVEKRKVYHSRRVKVDKMSEQIASSQQQASVLGSTPIRPAPLPPQNLPFSSMSISNSAPYPINNVMPMPSYK